MENQIVFHPWRVEIQTSTNKQRNKASRSPRSFSKTRWDLTFSFCMHIQAAQRTVCAFCHCFWKQQNDVPKPALRKTPPGTSWTQLLSEQINSEVFTYSSWASKKWHAYILDMDKTGIAGQIGQLYCLCSWHSGCVYRINTQPLPML